MKFIVLAAVLLAVVHVSFSLPTYLEARSSSDSYTVAFLWPEANNKGTPQKIQDTAEGFLKNKCYPLNGSPILSAASTGTTLILLFEQPDCTGDLRGELIRGGSKDIKPGEGEPANLKPVSVRLVYDRVGSGGF